MTSKSFAIAAPALDRRHFIQGLVVAGAVGFGASRARAQSTIDIDKLLAGAKVAEEPTPKCLAWMKALRLLRCRASQPGAEASEGCLSRREAASSRAPSRARSAGEPERSEGQCSGAGLLGTFGPSKVPRPRGGPRIKKRSSPEAIPIGRKRDRSGRFFRWNALRASTPRHAPSEVDTPENAETQAA